MGDGRTPNYRLVTARHPTPGEKSVLNQTLKKYLAKYQKDTEAAKKLTSVGESPDMLLG